MKNLDETRVCEYKGDNSDKDKCRINVMKQEMIYERSITITQRLIKIL